MKNLIPKIGLEIHVELCTTTKLFCDCPNNPDETHPNTNICEICTGQPGVLPVPNKQAVIYILSLANAFKMKINNPSIFARKHYFYPDLPKNYQISQYELPIAFEGIFEIYRKNFSKTIRIRRIHLEEDAGRLIHLGDKSLVDFNRAGVPLIEIVTEPDFRSSEEVIYFAEDLITLVRHLGISKANPEKGEIRFEANISLGIDDNLGTKVEIKNLNSLRALEESTLYEIERQKQIILSGEEVIQETRGWDENKKRTFSQRYKEEAEDYRYFPEPDIPPLFIDEGLKKEIIEIELPSERKKRFEREFNLEFSEAHIIVKDKILADFFENTISELKSMGSNNIKLLKNFLINDILGLLNKFNKNLSDLDFKPQHFAKLAKAFEDNLISSKIFKDILSKIIKDNADADNLLKENQKIVAEPEILNYVNEAIKNNQQAVQDFVAGKKSALEFIVGYVMKLTKGKADIEITRKLIEQKLNELKEK